MYAIIRSGGKQYRAEVGATIDVDRLPNDVGDSIEIGDVLLVANGDDAVIGQPRVAGAFGIGNCCGPVPRQKDHRIQISPAHKLPAQARTPSILHTFAH